MERAAAIRAHLGLMTSTGNSSPGLTGTREHLRKAEAVLGKGPDTAGLVALYWGIAHVASEMTQVAEGLAASRRALEVAERIGDDAGWVRAAGARVCVLFTGGPTAQAFAVAHRSDRKAARL